MTIRHRMSASLAVGSVVVGSLVAAGVSSPSVAATAVSPPAVDVTVLASGLNVPWDLAVMPDGAVLFDQRGGGFSVINTTGVVRAIAADFSDLRVGNEAGLTGLVLDPKFQTNRTFYTCQASTAPDVRVIRWTIDRRKGTATRVGAPLITGIPANTFHQGCRLRFDSAGYLQVGTGDAGGGTNPQDLTSLGGKTLRMRTDGSPAPGNPFASKGGNAAYVWTYGHRNVEGMALRPGTSQMWNAEHGPDIDDEVNLVQRGGNYGWDPVPSYNQSVPMTDLTKFPDAKVAAWSSGNPTLATSGLTFVQGKAWGAWNGGLAVGLLKAQGILFMKIGADNKVTQTAMLPSGAYGRIRTVQSGPGGVLYVTTSDADGQDQVLAITPR